MNQINIRHHFLSRFIGTKDKENQSFHRANNVNLWLTITTCICPILEIVLYLVYNRMVIFNNTIPIATKTVFQVHPWLRIVKDASTTNLSMGNIYIESRE